jgi:hypothetical protein
MVVESAETPEPICPKCPPLFGKTIRILWISAEKSLFHQNKRILYENNDQNMFPPMIYVIPDRIQVKKRPRK